MHRSGAWCSDCSFVLGTQWEIYGEFILTGGGSRDRSWFSPQVMRMTAAGVVSHPRFSAYFSLLPDGLPLDYGSTWHVCPGLQRPVSCFRASLCTRFR